MYVCGFCVSVFAGDVYLCTHLCGGQRSTSHAIPCFLKQKVSLGHRDYKIGRQTCQGLTSYKNTSASYWM